MKETFGKMYYAKKGGHPFWFISGARPTMMINRIIPSCYMPEPNLARVPDNTANVEHLKWLMMRYPLEIESKPEWDNRVKKLKKYGEIAKKTKVLKQVIPSPKFKGELLDYQKECLDFLQKTQGHALIADEMGLGKTVETLAYLASAKQSLPCLVIAPLVTLRNWEREITKFLGKSKIHLIRSGKQGDLGNYDFYVVNYEMIWRRIDDIVKLPLRTLILDEVQSIRSRSTKKYESIKELAGLETINNRIGLSGTPIYNRGSEVWSICDIIRPGMLGAFNEFSRTFCSMDYRGNYYVESDKRDTLREELRDKIMLRRKKTEVLKELKDKIRYKETVESDLDYYEAELEKIRAKLEETQKNAKTSFEMTSAYQRASESERQAAGIAKLPHVVKFVENIMEMEEAVVVFCHHRALHEMLYKSLEKYNPARIIGGQTDNERQKEIDRFQHDGDHKDNPWTQTNLLIAGLRAGNMGINLTRASYVVFAELDWTPAIHRQAEDRLHRIGQEKTVFAYYLIGEGTLDESVAKVLVDKSLEIDTVMDDKVESYENEEKAQQILARINKK